MKYNNHNKKIIKKALSYCEQDSCWILLEQGSVPHQGHPMTIHPAQGTNSYQLAMCDFTKLNSFCLKLESIAIWRTSKHIISHWMEFTSIKLTGWTGWWLTHFIMGIHSSRKSEFNSGGFSSKKWCSQRVCILESLLLSSLLLEQLNQFHKIKIGNLSSSIPIWNTYQLIDSSPKPNSMLLIGYWLNRKWNGHILCHDYFYSKNIFLGIYIKIFGFPSPIPSYGLSCRNYKMLQSKLPKL